MLNVHGLRHSTLASATSQSETKPTAAKAELCKWLSNVAQARKERKERTDKVESQRLNVQGIVATASQDVGGGSRLGDAPTWLDTGALLEGYFDYEKIGFLEAVEVCGIYTDIYLHHYTAGSIVDVLVEGALGKFTVEQGELSDDEYERFMRQWGGCLNWQDVFSRMLRDRLIHGSAAASLLVDGESADEQKLVGIYQFDRCDYNLTPVPLSGFQPLMEANWPALMVSDYTRFQSQPEIGDYLTAIIPPHLFEPFKKRSFVKPDNAVVSVNVPLSRNECVSIFRRILPDWFYARNMLRGNLENSIARINGVSHIAVGMGQGFDAPPRIEDLQYYADLFAQAKQDPTGAMVVTRDGVNINEVLAAGGHWQYDSMAESTATRMLRAMRCPEGLLTLDWTADLTQVSAAVTLLNSIRQSFTQEVIVGRIFLQLSILAKNFHEKALSEVELDAESVSYASLLKTKQPIDRFVKLPTIRWERKLEVRPDPTMQLDLFEKLKGMGIPSPVLALAAAADIDLETVLANRNRDLEMRKQLKDYSDEIGKVSPPPADGGGGGMDFGASASGFFRPAPEKPVSALTTTQVATASANLPKLHAPKAQSSRGHFRPFRGK